MAHYAFLVSAPIVVCIVPDALLPVVNAPCVVIGANWIYRQHIPISSSLIVVTRLDILPILSDTKEDAQSC
jgi:hypothetical protein